MNPTTVTTAPRTPTGALRFKAVRVQDVDRVSYIGAIPVLDLLQKNFIAPVASAGLSPEVLKIAATNGPVQRKTNPGHVQAIVDYISGQAEKGQPWAFGSVVLYSTSRMEFDGVSVGREAAGEVTATEPFSVGEGLHRCLAWAVLLGLAKVRGVKCPELSDAARRRISLAAIPVIAVEEEDLAHQRVDFHHLNLQKALTNTVLTLTDSSALSELTRWLITDVKLFDGRIELNNANVGPTSGMLLSFAQLRFVAASCLLGKRTRSPRGINTAVAQIVADRGEAEVRADLRATFTQIATRLGGLQRLHANTLPSASGDHVRTLRAETLLASSATWRALCIALHDAKQAGVDVETALDRVQHDPQINWSRNAEFFAGTLLEQEVDETGTPTGRLTGRLLSSRESIDTAAAKLTAVMASGVL